MAVHRNARTKMCGIAGIFSNVGSIDSASLSDMGESLHHRGPDDSGYYRSGPIGLAHRRLSILDLNRGNQPIFNETESVVVIFNGEIYNYRDLRKSLSAAGHTFTTETDTEVLVHLYEEEGASFAEQLRGMFAFALWDADEERLLLGRDGMGIKPLLLAEDDDKVAFASELPALLKTDIDHGGLDQVSLSQYFGFGFIPAPRTAFNNVSKLLPGQLIIISKGDVQRTSFYTPTVRARDPGIDTATKEVRNRLKTAVDRRLQSDVPIGAFLSGGIDSSIVVGILSETLDDPLRTFTVGFEADRFDEAWAARLTANYHETDHTEFTVSAEDVRDTIPNVLDCLGEPFADQSLIPFYTVAKETSNEVKVAFSGDGADELFAGYDRYRGEYLSKYYRSLPGLLRRHVIEPVVSSLPASRSNNFGEFSRKAKKFVRGTPTNPSDRHFEWVRIPGKDAVPTIRQDIVSAGRTEMASQYQSIGTWYPSEHRSSVDAMQAAEVRFTLPNQLLQKVDSASMYNSLEVRVPYLDINLVEYALGLPARYKMTARSRKRVLRNAFDDILPKVIASRGKQGFDMPIGQWFRNELANDFRTIVSRSNSNILNVDRVLDLHDDHCSGRGEHGKFLWTTYVFAYWLNRMRQEEVLE